MRATEPCCLSKNEHLLPIDNKKSKSKKPHTLKLPRVEETNNKKKYKIRKTPTTVGNPIPKRNK